MKYSNFSPHHHAFSRWIILTLVSLPMLGAYFLADSLSPLETQLETTLGWGATDYGCYTGAYGWFNVFLFMLIFGGMILDKMGIRFTGILSICVMLFGAGIKYLAISKQIGTNTIIHPLVLNQIKAWFVSHFSIKESVLFAGLGFAIFGIGIEMFGITANKAILRWFRGREFAMATGINTSTGRVGTTLALYSSVPLVNVSKKLHFPIICAIGLLIIGLFSFLRFIFLDKKFLSKKERNNQEVQEEFKWTDLKEIVRIKAFWLITALAVSFYASVITFIKYGTLLIHQKFHVSSGSVGHISCLLPLIALILTPIFGNFCDRKGKGSSLMIIGSCISVGVYLLFAIPALHTLYFAIGLVLILGIAFSLVPAVLWPGVARIVPEQKLGTVYSMIVWLQNLSYIFVPMWVGSILNRHCIIGKESQLIKGVTKTTTLYNYTLPMLLFACLGILAILFAVMLKQEDAKKKYGLEKSNIEY